MKFNVWGREFFSNAKLGKVAIFDLDGTLSNGSHRLHLLPKKDLHLTESWSDFNRAAENDSPITDTLHVMEAMYSAGYCVIILTGRSDEVESETVEWLSNNFATYDHLIMRRSFDNRKDTSIKEEVLRAIGLENIVACWDDSPNVIAHLRSMGLTVYQVCDYGEKLHDHLKSHGVDCIHEWERHSEQDHYFDCCLKCGDRRNIK